MINHDALGTRIKEVRGERRITQAKLAERADLSDVYISHIETGRKKVGLDALVRIANALRVTVDYLLAGQQSCDRVSGRTEADALLRDCTDYEKAVLLKNMKALKTALRESRWMVESAER